LLAAIFKVFPHVMDVVDAHIAPFYRQRLGLLRRICLRDILGYTGPIIQP
jgi:hypothetical protein